MSPADIVIYIADPLLYGKLIIIGVHEDGRLLCEAFHKDGDGEYARELFDAHELKLASRWKPAPAHLMNVRHVG